MKNESESKKIKYITFFIYFIGYFLIIAITNMFDKQIQLFIHSINIFSNFSDSLIRILYLFLLFCVLEKLYQ
ncbi:hypothetical protein PT285_11305, partial [Lactobacillus sp. ESL0791]|uniref:hypothetical protein n=1 Tax=Lactobacillus sp. ESL0791 TaxID=2983234 RepID=UPI0023F6520E